MTTKKALTVRKSPAKRLTVADLLPLVAPCRGNVSAIARAAGVCRQTVYRRIEESRRLQAAVEDAREERIDAAESALDAAVERGEGWAIALTLRTIGRERGYGDAADLNLNTSVEVTIGFADPAEDDEATK